MTKQLLLCAVLGAVSCSPTSPSGLPVAYVGVITAEWSQAQAQLNSLGVPNVDLVIPTICTWAPHDGPFDGASFKGINGMFDPNGFVIRWNIHTPGVLRHEAGHAILKFLDHPCWACWMVEGTAVMLHTGRCETSKTGALCRRLLGSL